MKKATLYHKQYNKGNFVWPSWVYKAHEAEMLYIRTREELDKSLLLSTKRMMSFPENPTDLSYWIVQNLSLETKHRLKLMNIDSVNQRLRAELSIMQQLNHQVHIQNILEIELMFIKEIFCRRMSCCVAVSVIMPSQANGTCLPCQAKVCTRPT